MIASLAKKDFAECNKGKTRTAHLISVVIQMSAYYELVGFMVSYGCFQK